MFLFCGEALNHFDTTMTKNNILHCEKLFKADWLTMMGNSDIRHIPPIIISLAQADSDMESDFQFSSDSETDSFIFVTYFQFAMCHFLFFFVFFKY
jgi:hypothetical protein